MAMATGFVDDKSSGGITLGVLHHFRIGDATLHSSHKDWLSQKVVPLLKAGGSISIVGQASRSGSDQTNKILSERRAASVRGFLEQAARQSFPFQVVTGTGESAAASAGQKDGKEDGYFRSVIIIAHSRPTPPDPKVITQPPAPTPPAEEPTDIWIGVGEGHSGDLVLAGYYNWNAPRVVRLGTNANGEVDWVNIMSDGFKFGGGLGGSVSGIVIFARGIKRPEEFRQAASWSDLDFELALGGNLGSVLKGIKGIGTVVNVMDKYKKLAHAAQELAKNQVFYKPGVYTISIPGAGAGMHVWAGRKYGGITLHSSGSVKLV